MSEDSLPRGSELLDRSRSTLVVIDVQEKLLPAVCDGPRLVDDLVTLVRGAGELGVPLVVTEQYPKGLGPTVAPLRSLLPAPIEKLRMSACRALGWPPASGNDRWQVVLCGLETHVCVLQTALDLVSLGYQVFVPVDAVSCRFAVDGEIALRRMTAAGITLTTIEGALFEWLESAEAPEFKAISRLVKERAGRR
jgi:nicotinamidase-related amidase